jgi:hypothetical protein
MVANSAPPPSTSSNDEKHELLAKSLDHLAHENTIAIISHTWRETDTELEFIEKQMAHWRLVGRVKDDRTERWRKYGRVGHDAQPGAISAQQCEVFMFAKEAPSGPKVSSGPEGQAAAC